MDVESLRDEEKSVVLAKLMGWRVNSIRRESGAWQRVLCDDTGKEIEPMILFAAGLSPKEVELRPSKRFNLYDPARMVLACRVLLWASRVPLIDYDEFCTCAVNLVIYGQRGALDYVLISAIEAGRVGKPSKK